MKDKKIEEQTSIQFVKIDKHLSSINRSKLPYLGKGKTIAVVVSCIYLLAASFYGGESFFRMLYFVLFCLGLIYFGDAFGNFAGSSWGMGGSAFRRIDTPTPGILIQGFGYFLLAYPIISTIIVLVFTKG